MNMRKYYRDTETMSPDERKQFTDEKIRWIVNYAYEKAPGIKLIMDKAGISPSEIRGSEDLVKLPIIDKEKLVQLQRENLPFGGILTAPISNVERVFFSPGPLYEPDPPAELAAEALYSMGFRPGDVVVNTFSYHLTPGGMIMEQGLRKIGVTVVPTGVGNTDTQAQIMLELGVTGFIGAPGFLMNILERVKQKGTEGLRLKRAVLTAEMIPVSVKKELESYGIIPVEGYGTAETGFFAYECEERNGFHIAEGIFVEIVDPQSGERLADGEVGEIIATTFNPVYPLVRFGTGDLSSISHIACPCGRTSARLGRILGRVGGAATKVRGIFIHPGQIGRLASATSGIKKAQLVISHVGRRDNLLLKVDIEEGIDPETLRQPINDNFQQICRLKLDNIEFCSLKEDEDLLIDKREWD